MSKPEYEALVDDVARKMPGSSEDVERYREPARAILALIHEKLRTPTQAMVEAWVNLHKSSENANIFRAMLNASALIPGACAMSKYTPSPEAVEAACKAFQDVWSNVPDDERARWPDDYDVAEQSEVRLCISAALTAAAPFIRAETVEECARVIGKIPDDPVFDRDEGPARRICSFAALCIRALQPGDQP